LTVHPAAFDFLESSTVNCSLTMETTLTWRHPLDKDPNITIPDTATVEQYQIYIANYRLMKRNYSHPFQLRDAIPGPLSIETCHGFCGKASAIYSTVDLKDLQVGMFDYLFPEWFSLVTINDTGARFYSEFFAKFIASHYQGSPKTLEGIVKAHRLLSDQVGRRMREVPDASSAQYSYGDDVEHNDQYPVLPTFKDIVIVCDSVKIEEDGVLLVLLDPARAEGIAGMSDMKAVEVEGNAARTLRASVQRIMRLVVEMQEKA